MTQEENDLLGTPEVDKLVTEVEEATRATKESPRRFIEPARGTLDRAKARRHHIVFGRRGSGKTSLLRKAGADLTLKRIPMAFIDLEAFKGHEYPDVLLSILIETLSAFDQWLATAGSNPSTKTTFWNRIWGAKPSRPPLNPEKMKKVRSLLSTEMNQLNQLLHSEDQIEVTTRTGGVTRESDRQSDSLRSNVSGELRVPVARVGGSLEGRSQTEQMRGTERQEERTEKSLVNKMGYLHRRIIHFQKIFESMTELSGSDAFIFLDDLYHLRRRDQPHVLDYFHRIVKGRSVWLKVGTIRHRTDWYHHGQPPVGLKLGDDCDDIDLDITLEKYELARRFLLQILDQLVKEAGLTRHQSILAEGGVERLVLASGGVARDFLTIFRRAVDVARERGRTYRGDRVNAEDVNVAAGEHDQAKQDELRRDTLEERVQLESALDHIQSFCIENSVNCFLVEQDSRYEEGVNLLGELVDLRFVHVVQSRTTVRDKPGKLFTAYMLDISQYTGARRRREMQIISFWKRDDLDRIRRSKYVLDRTIL